MTEHLSKLFDKKLLLDGSDYFKNQVPGFITSNLNPKFVSREYQLEAFGRFTYYFEKYQGKKRNKPTHLLYHMATGSGKTFIMAGLILYLFSKGYSNFVFFVNNTNILEKTKDNFLNSLSIKFLFSNELSINENKPQIRQVNNFQAVDQNDINIVFTTIQALHYGLNNPAENSVTYDDFEDKKLVLISDEAHHINAETKKGNQKSFQENEEIVSWEGTVNRLVNSSKENVLLEFTATIDLLNDEIEKKYSDKIIYDYSLKQFCLDGYSKEVKVFQADLSTFERSLISVLLSQFRRKLFEKNKLNIKPVILFKSRTIKDSRDFFKEFVRGISKLNSEGLEMLRKKTNNPLVEELFSFFLLNDISITNLITEIQEDFSEEKLLMVNSKEESEENQIAVNTLEDKNNRIRAVFAVDKLNEGWDVLNLFDIVRLYDTRDARYGIPGNTTMSEAQLIGRGARYCPFRISDDQPLYQRKFSNTDNELSLCEELIYHSSYNPKYIQELNSALDTIGINIKEHVRKNLNIKENFKGSNFYEKGLLFLNEKKKNVPHDIFELMPDLLRKEFNVNLHTGYSKKTDIFDIEDVAHLEVSTKIFKFQDFGKFIIRKAINKLDFYKFSNLLTYLPNLRSISEFINSDSYLGKITVRVSGAKANIDNLSQDEKIGICVEVLLSIAEDLKSNQVEYKGSKTFKPYLLKEKIDDVVLKFSKNDSEDQEFGKSMNNPLETNYYLDLSNKDWFVFNDFYGTSEEKKFVKYVDAIYEQFANKFHNIYLVRNEKFFTIYSFKDGKAFEPDFVLFLESDNPDKSIYYQVFIEPKGDHLLEHDYLKEEFLLSIKEEHKITQLLQNKEFIIWGMPFFNENQRKEEFIDSINELLS